MKVFLILFLFAISSFTQDKKISLEEMKVDGIILIDKMVRPELLDEEEIEDQTLSDEEVINDQKLKKKDLNKKLEELEKRPGLDSIPEAPLPETPKEPEVKAPELKEPSLEAPKKKKVYDFLFDKEKKAVFKTKTFFRSFKLGLGAFSFYPNKYQESGKGGKIGHELNPALGLGIEYGSPNFLSFQVDTFFTLPKTSPDKLMNEFRFGLEFHAYFRVLPILRPFVGTTVAFNVLNSKETNLQKLPGGQGSFFNVATPRTSINNTLDVGLELKLSKLSFDLKTSFTSLFDKQKRDMSYGLMVNYYFDWAKKKEISEQDNNLDNELPEPSLESTLPALNNKPEVEPDINKGEVVSPASLTIPEVPSPLELPKELPNDLPDEIKQSEE